MWYMSVINIASVWMTQLIYTNAANRTDGGTLFSNINSGMPDLCLYLWEYHLCRPTQVDIGCRPIRLHRLHPRLSLVQHHWEGLNKAFALKVEILAIGELKVWISSRGEWWFDFALAQVKTHFSWTPARVYLRRVLDRLTDVWWWNNTAWIEAVTYYVV